MIKYPDYQNSILNLINSIEKYYGVDYEYPTLDRVDRILDKGYRNVVVMVFDALGSKNLQSILPEDSFLRKHMLKEISSVFPPTTVAATTTLESGLAPAEHSWLGWSLHFSELNDNVNVFTNTNFDGKIAADYNVAEYFIPYKNVVHKINEVSDTRAESISRFGTYHINNFEDIMDSVQKLCNENGRHYLYSYWNEPDSSMHAKGIESDEVVKWVEQINKEVEKLSNQVNDTVIFVIADHGHINGKNKYIGDYPDILDTLKWLPTIEPRTLAFYMKEGREEEFKDAFLRHFKDDFMLLSKHEVINLKLFGNGKTHLKFEEFIGDFLAIAISDVSIFNNTEEVKKFIGVHAGMTETEMMVPLIAIERK